VVERGHNQHCDDSLYLPYKLTPRCSLMGHLGGSYSLHFYRRCPSLCTFRTHLRFIFSCSGLDSPRLFSPNKEVKSFVKCLAHDEILKMCVPLVPKVHTHVVLCLNFLNSICILCLIKNSNMVTKMT
jgi:hypothetical protein